MYVQMTFSNFNRNLKCPYCLQPLVHLTWKLFCPICRRYSPWRMAISSIFLHVPSLKPGTPHILLQRLHLEIGCRHTQLCTCTSLPFFSLFFFNSWCLATCLLVASLSSLSSWFLACFDNSISWCFLFSQHFLTAAAFFCLYSSNCPEVFNFSTKRLTAFVYLSVAFLCCGQRNNIITKVYEQSNVLYWMTALHVQKWKKLMHH